jgi:ABC-type sulfate/molybdate transport systems ATPase subunit
MTFGSNLDRRRFLAASSACAAAPLLGAGRAHAQSMNWRAFAGQKIEVTLVRSPRADIVEQALPVLAAEAQRVTAYIRPHELAIVRDAEDGIPAIVRRVLELGALARVELTTEAGQGYEAEIPQSELAGLALSTGEAVRLVPRAVRLFPRDVTAG